MLKIIYSDTGVHLELLAVDEREWIEQRLDFAVSIGEPMEVRTQTATFLLPSPVCDITLFEQYLHSAGAKSLTVNRCDRDCVEIGIAGEWLFTDPDSAEGIFVTQQLDRVESSLWELWDAANGQLVTYDM